MSVGKLVPKGKNTIKGLVRGKEDAPIFLHITSSEQVGMPPPSAFVLLIIEKLFYLIKIFELIIRSHVLPI